MLPQSPSLSGQSHEELVIFNTAGGVVQVSERPNALSVRAGAHLTSPSVYPFSQWDHSNWLCRDRGIC